LPLALLGLPLYAFLPGVYADELGLGLAAVGAALLAARALDVVSDPLLGWLSDRGRGRAGRRLPWLALAAPLLLLAAWRLFEPPAGAGIAHLVLWSALAYLAWTALTLPYQALGAELAGDYHERARLTAAREGAALVGTFAAVAVAGAVQAGGGAGREALGALWLVLAVTLPLAVGLALWRLREPPVPPSAPLGWREGARLVAANAPFRRLLAAWLLNGMANALPATLVLLYVEHALGLARYTGLFLAAYFVAGVAALPLWLALARRVGKHRAWALSMAWACLAFAAVPSLGSGDLVPFLAVCVLSGASLGADNALPAAIQADVIDHDTAGGGDGRAGLYFGLWGMATKLALALAVGVAFPLLAALGFDPARGAGDPAPLVWLYAALPVALKLCAVPLAWSFPLDEAAVRALRARLVPLAPPAHPIR
jgi:Na+/melibiose symporter-like transporter